MLELHVEGPNGESRVFEDLEPALMPEPPWILELRPSMATLIFQVFSPEGAALQDASVSVFLRARRTDGNLALVRGSRMSKRTGADGQASFRIADPDLVLFSWSVLSPVGDLLQGDTQPLPSLDETGHGRVVVRFGSRADRIEGRVRPYAEDDDFAQLQFLWVEARGFGEAEVSARASTGADGQFVLHGLEPGTYMLSLPRFPDAEPAPANAGSTGVELRLPAMRTLRIRVRDALTGKPVAGSRAFLYTGGMRSGGLNPFHAGELVGTNVDPRADTVLVWKEGYAVLPLSLLKHPEWGLVDLRANLERGRRLELGFESAGEQAPEVAALLWHHDAGVPPMRLKEADIVEVDSSRGTLLWPRAPSGALVIQAVGEDDRPFGELLQIPAGSADRQLWLDPVGGTVR
ncbi:MAG: hypothetical protein DWQ01_00485 [Planctomycetota bacterium]|nr:MAG: hypothetical protein DWQ01_00485 [Planctomycetota bacterium]